jgi:hypothetical protein
MNEVLSYKIVDIKLDKEDLTIMLSNGKIDKYRVREGILDHNNYNQCIDKDILAYGVSGNVLIVTYLEDRRIVNIPFILEKAAIIISNETPIKITISYDHCRKNIIIVSDSINVSFKSNIIPNKLTFTSEKVIIVNDGYVTDVDAIIKYFNCKLGKCINIDKVASNLYHVDTEEATVIVTTDKTLATLEQIKGWDIEYVITHDDGKITLVIAKPNERVVINL